MPKRILKISAVVGLLASLALYLAHAIHPDAAFMPATAETVKWACLGGAGVSVGGALVNLKAMEFRNVKYYLSLGGLFAFGAALSFISISF